MPFGNIIPLEVTPFSQEEFLYAYWGGAYNEKEGVMLILEDFVSIKFKTMFRSLTVSCTGMAPIDMPVWKGASPRTAGMLLRECGESESGEISLPQGRAHQLAI